jgi:hypothetical protein
VLISDDPDIFVLVDPEPESAFFRKRQHLQQRELGIRDRSTALGRLRFKLRRRFDFGYDFVDHYWHYVCLLTVQRGLIAAERLKPYQSNPTLDADAEADAEAVAVLRPLAEALALALAVALADADAEALARNVAPPVAIAPADSPADGIELVEKAPLIPVPRDAEAPNLNDGGVSFAEAEADKPPATPAIPALPLIPNPPPTIPPPPTMPAEALSDAEAPNEAPAEAPRLAPADNCGTASADIDGRRGDSTPLNNAVSRQSDSSCPDSPATWETGASGAGELSFGVFLAAVLASLLLNSNRLSLSFNATVARSGMPSGEKKSKVSSKLSMMPTKANEPH